MPNPLQSDLDHILAHTNGLWDELRGKRIFITGGTGFFGCWLLESFVRANDEFGLKAEVVVLTRDPEAFDRKVPHLARHPAVWCHKGDVRDFQFPEGQFSHVIHAAAEADTTLNKADPLKTWDTIVKGTQRTVEFTNHAKASAILLVSSGAVYGPQPEAVARIAEDYGGAPNPLVPASAYGEGKRAAELWAVAGSARSACEVKIARGFAFLGPYLPLNGSFAAGNFVRDALGGGPVIVMGDGTAVRSYLYGADLAIWLWTILIRGRTGRAYNVGGEHEVSMVELAKVVAQEHGKSCSIKIMMEPIPGKPVVRYVPDTQRARDELGLTQHIALEEAIRKMFKSYAKYK